MGGGRRTGRSITDGEDGDGGVVDEALGVGADEEGTEAGLQAGAEDDKIGAAVEDVVGEGGGGEGGLQNDGAVGECGEGLLLWGEEFLHAFVDVVAAVVHVCGDVGGVVEGLSPDIAGGGVHDMDDFEGGAMAGGEVDGILEGAGGDLGEVGAHYDLGELAVLPVAEDEHVAGGGADAAGGDGAEAFLGEVVGGDDQKGGTGFLDGVVEFLGGAAGADFHVDFGGGEVEIDHFQESAFGLFGEEILGGVGGSAGGAVFEGAAIEDMDGADGGSGEAGGEDGMPQDGLGGGGEVDAGDDGGRWGSWLWWGVW